MSSGLADDKGIVSRGEQAMPLQVPVRVHDACFTSGEPYSLASPEILCSVECDCGLSAGSTLVSIPPSWALARLPDMLHALQRCSGR